MSKDDSTPKPPEDKGIMLSDLKSSRQKAVAKVAGKKKGAQGA